MKPTTSTRSTRQPCSASPSGRFPCGFVSFEDADGTGLVDFRLGQASGKRVPSEREAQIEPLYRSRWFHGEALPRAPRARARLHLGSVGKADGKPGEGALPSKRWRRRKLMSPKAIGSSSI